MNLIEQIKKGEGKTVELKEKLPKGDGISKTVIAFANTSGGKLIIGIDDSRNIVGLEETEIFDLQEKVASLIYDSCAPGIIPEIYATNIDGRLVLVVEVFRGGLLPYYLKKKGKNAGTYIRVGSTNRVADLPIIQELERARLNISFDEETNYDFKIQDLDLTPIMNQFYAKKKKPDQQKLINLKLVNEEHGEIFPSNALLILLGKFENTVIKCSRFKGVNMDVFLDKKEYFGDLFGQIENAENFIKNHINLHAEISGLQREETYEIPTEAIREAIVNAVVHRDYSNPGRDIKVGVYDHLVNIVSPGAFPSTLTNKEIFDGRSEIRNRGLAKVFKELGLIEQWGTGIRRMVSSCLNHGLKKPNINERGNFVDVEIFRETKKSEQVTSSNVSDVVSKYSSNGINSISTAEYGGIAADYGGLDYDEKLIFDYIMKNGKISTKYAKVVIGAGDSKVKKTFVSMIAKKLIVRMGKGRSTYYVPVK